MIDNCLWLLLDKNSNLSRLSQIAVSRHRLLYIIHQSFVEHTEQVVLVAWMFPTHASWWKKSSSSLHPFLTSNFNPLLRHLNKLTKKFVSTLWGVKITLEIRDKESKFLFTKILNSLKQFLSFSCTWTWLQSTRVCEKTKKILARNIKSSHTRVISSQNLTYFNVLNEFRRRFNCSRLAIFKRFSLRSNIVFLTQLKNVAEGQGVGENEPKKRFKIASLCDRSREEGEKFLRCEQNFEH